MNAEVFVDTKVLLYTIDEDPATSVRSALDSSGGTFSSM